MRRSRSTLPFRALCYPILGTILLLSGCGGSNSAAGGPKTEEEARYASIRKLGEGYSKGAVAEARKKAVLEGKAKPETPGRPDRRRRSDPSSANPSPVLDPERASWIRPFVVEVSH